MTRSRAIVVLGAGHAGVQAAASLREEGVTAPIALISGEPHLPYDRPPLSKRLLLGEAQGDDILLRDAAFYPKHDISLLLGERVLALDLSARRVNFASTDALEYRDLILATGSTNRGLPFACPPMEGLVALRSLDEAFLLRAQLGEAKRVAVIGAGFIGMEVAAVAAKLGCAVHVVELGDRPLARSVSRVTSDFFVEKYVQKGVRFTFGSRIEGVEERAGRARGVRLDNGTVVHADLVLVAVGAVACDALAAQSGLPCGNGIQVDASMRTAVPHVFAIGDCAVHPNRFAGRMLRLESVQNAVDQARVVARVIAGKSAVYDSVPWFWSDLGEWRLQIAGFMDQCDHHVLRGRPEEGKYSIYGFRSGKLVGVESVNRAADHLLAKRLLTTGVPIQPELAADESVDLKQLLQVTVSPGKG